MEYNNNAARMMKRKLDIKREKDRFYGQQYNELVENQAKSHLINRTAQQGRFETKRQVQDLKGFHDRTMTVKRTVDDLIEKYKQNN